ncbi:MAG: efflux RND transporter permease subunit, partial [Lachnospiraceae bacterium]|nr:efflux RND transporter permease subunit [Lachnospiraceae bacterium]
MSKLSVKKPFTVLVMIIIMIVLGTVSIIRMQMDLLPHISLPYVLVITTYPGESP